MILLALYAMAIWMIAFKHRRRWIAWAALLAGVPLIPLVAFADVHMVGALTGENVTFLYIPAFVFAAVIALVGVMLALLRPPLPDHVCATCGYDLRGNVLGVCPECGEAVNGSARTAASRALHNPAKKSVQP